jgi:hypothetical protein
MTRSVRLRAALLIIAAVGLIAGLTVYFSSEKIPPCLVSTAPKWRAPSDGATHRFLLVVPDRALCFYAIDDEHKLVGAVKLHGIQGIDAIEPRGRQLAIHYRRGGALLDLASGRASPAGAPPRPSLTVSLVDRVAQVEYTTRPGELGFRVVVEEASRRYRFGGFAWNPRFGPDPPDHGLVLLPGQRQLWVLDAPNSATHVYDVSGVPREAPTKLDDVRFSKPISGDENPCAHPRCGRIGSLGASSDGRYAYVGDSGDVIDAQKREVVLNLEALHQSRLMIEVDWVAGQPVFRR